MVKAATTATRSTADTLSSLMEIAPDCFEGCSTDINHIGSIFGGVVMAQALAAAMRTVDGLPVSSLHGYFLAPAVVSLPLEYRVDRLRDSRRFANRQVTAWQNHRRVFILACQFHAPEQGFEHQAVAMPDVPAPEVLPSLQDFVREHETQLDASVVHNFSGTLPVELRPTDPRAYLVGRPDRPVRDFWFRVPSAASVEDPRLQQCLLAYASDYWLAGVAAATHILPTNGSALLISSLDHSMWFHRPGRCDEWLLHHTSSPSAQDGLGLSQGYIFDRTGKLLASTAQESLLRRLSSE